MRCSRTARSSRRGHHRERSDAHGADGREDHPRSKRSRHSRSSVPTSTIGDVATVVQESDPVTSISRVDGKDALSISITKLPAANTVEVSNGVIAALDTISDAFPDAEFTIIFDQAPFIVQSIETLATEGLLGLVFAVIVILVFLMLDPLHARHSHLDPDERAHHLHRAAGVRLLAQRADPRCAHDRDRPRGRRLHRRESRTSNVTTVGDADKGDAIRLAVREVAMAITRHPRSRPSRCSLPIVFVRRHGRRAVPTVRHDRDHRDGRLAPGRPHHRPGARVLVPEAGQGARRRARATSSTPSTRMLRPRSCSASTGRSSAGR